MTLEERIAHLEFKMDLLFNGTDLDRYLYETDITANEYTAILDLMDSLRNKLEAGQEIYSGEFESDIYRLVPARYGDYHFCESIARLFAENGQWEEVFPALYGNLPKYGGTIG